MTSQEEVLQLLQGSSRRMSTTEIMEATHANRQSVSNALFKLRRWGAVIAVEADALPGRPLRYIACEEWGARPLEPEEKVCVRIPSALLEELDACAESMGVSRSEFIRSAIQWRVKEGSQ